MLSFVGKGVKILMPLDDLLWQKYRKDNMRNKENHVMTSQNTQQLFIMPQRLGRFIIVNTFVSTLKWEVRENYRW